MTKLPYKLLYALWIVMFAVTAWLGFVPAGDETTANVYRILTGLFFLPPWMIMLKARNEGVMKHCQVVKYLCLASLGTTVVLMALNVLSINWSEAMGTALNAALTIVSAPMMCGQGYFLSLFMWGTLLMGASSRN